MKLTKSTLAITALLLSNAAGANFTLNRLTNGDYPNAKCLDGSMYAYYTAITEASNDWMLYFEGGAWCFTKVSCKARALGNLGSSVNYTDAMARGECGAFEDCLIHHRASFIAQATRSAVFNRSSALSDQRCSLILASLLVIAPELTRFLIYSSLLVFSSRGDSL